MRTFCITTLGCKVNQYETEQIATLLRARGLTRTETVTEADLRIVNTCSVTIQAASKSRQTVRQFVKLPVLQASAVDAGGGETAQLKPLRDKQRVVVTGCWATSDKAEADKLPGVSAVITHHDDVARELDRLISLWRTEDLQPPDEATGTNARDSERPPEALRDDGWMIRTGALAAEFVNANKSQSAGAVKKKSATNLDFRPASIDCPDLHGTTRLPLLGERQDGHQRAFLKIQDGCDAHCTYCIIPTLRPKLWSKPIDDAVEEARRLVAAGHAELVLTGIFLGAYGQPTALRRRQPVPEDDALGIDTASSTKPLARLIDALCTRVPELRRLRLSSLEPGDLDADLISVLRAHPQVVPHFHLPLQSGSDRLLRRMNRQYTRDDFLRMADRVRDSFDRPALTTDVIVGFPGETDPEFARTLDVVDRTGFLHIHAFPFSPRPGTAAARWRKDFVRGPVVNERIDALRRRADEFSLGYRARFVGRTVELLVERPSADERDVPESRPVSLEIDGVSPLRHGRSERYFPVHFDAPDVRTGDLVRVRIDRVTPTRTHGALVLPPSQTSNHKPQIP